MKKNILATILTIISLIIAIVLIFVIVGKTKNKKPTTDTTITQEIVTDYNITYVLDEGVNNPNNPSKYNKNTTYTLLDATKDGYEFIGWYLDSSYTTKVTEINSSLNGDITLYAKFEEIIDYNITYYLYDGENDVDNPTIFNRLSNYTLKPASKDGYEFVGWFLEAGFTTQVTKLDSSLSSDIELHAKFVEIVNYNITYNLDGGTNDPDNITTFNKFTDFTLKNASKNKYEFKGWFLEAGFINQVTKIDSSFTEDIELFAKFEEIVYDYDYTITYHLDGGENNPNNPDGFFEDETIELYSATKTGYDFKGWYTSEAHTLEITTIEANMDYELYAWFDLHEYSITYHNVDGLSNENPSIYTITDGAFNLKNVDKPRYNFLGWYTTSTFDEESKITTIDSSSLKDYDLYAKFEVAPVEPTYSVIPNELTYNTLDQELLTYTVENGTIYFSLDNENYSTDIPTGKDAGDYVVYYKIIGINEEYLDILDQTTTITISKKLIDNSNIELVDETFTYDGTVKSLTYSGTLPEGITGVYYHDNEQINVGEYHPSMTFAYDTKNYTVSVLQIYGYLTIEKATIDMSNVEFNDLTVTYDGEAHSIIATNLPVEITNVTYTNNNQVNAGTYSITASFEYDTNNYNEVSNLTKTLTISKAIIDMSEVEFNDLTVTYDGNEHSITASNIPSLIIDVTYTNNGKVNAGTYEITVTFDYNKDNYTATKDSLTKTLTINPASITGATVTGYKGDFDDESHNAAAEYSATTVDGSTITWLFSNDNATWVSVDELTVKNPSDSKTYYYKASAANHEDLTGTFTVKIRTIATITIVNLAALSKTYDGNYIVDPIIETNSSSTPYITYTWGPNGSAQKPVNANTYTINVQVAENEDYTACVVTGTIVISKADYALPSNLFADKTVTYTGEEFELIINGTLPSTLEVTYTNNKLTNVGSILATATFENNSDNYNDVEPMTATLTINKATPTTSGISVNYDEGVGSFFTTNKSTSSIEFVGTYSTTGAITYTDSRTSLEIGTLSYSYRFTPTDTHNYETIDGTVEITTKATVEYYDETTLLNTLYVAKNETATNLSLTPKVGYTANGWTLTGSTTLYDFTTLVTTNLSLTAKYTIIEYTISYELNGGTNNPNNPTSYFVTSETMTLLDPSKDDANFLGWYTEDTFDNKVTQITKGSTGNIKLYAKFEEILPNSVHITYELNGGENNSNNPNYFTADDTPFTLLNPTKGSAFTFDGWYLDDEFTQRIVTVDPSIMTSDFTVYAKWSALNYSIMYYYGSERITTLNPKSYTIEDTITLPTYSVYNHTFNGWYLDSEFNTQITTIDAGSTGTVKLYAKLTDNGFTVKFYDTDKDTLLETKNASTYGSVTAPSYSYDDHIYLLKWVNKATNELVELNYIDNNYNLYAELVVISYTANIYYVDADGYSTAKTGTPIITSKTINNLTYGDEISLYRQMRVTDASAYDLFYMTPIDLFDWSLVVGSLAIGAQKIASDNSCTCYATVEGNAGTIRVYVFCIQPVAIITGLNEPMPFAQNLDMPLSTYQFYSTIDSAFEAFASQTGKLMRIYGRYNGTLTSNCFSNTSNTTINQQSTTVDGITITRPKLVYYCADCILTNSYHLTSGSIILPYSRKCINTSGYKIKTASASSSAVVHSMFAIASGVTLSLAIDVTIGGDIYSNCGLAGRGVIINNGTIVVESGTHLISYGFLKGNGNVIVESGATLSDFFYIYDWPGGANALGYYNKNIFPFEVFSFHNVSCKTRIYSGATYKAFCQLYMAENYITQDMILIGTGGLFQLTSGYVDKSVEDTTSTTNTNTSYTASNLNQTVRDILDIHGNFTDNSMSIRVLLTKYGTSVADETISTSTSMALPIGFMTIKISEGTSTLSKNSYKFLPGSSLIIEKLAKLTINSGVKVIFFDDYPDMYQYTDSDSTVKNNPYSYQVKHSAIYTDGVVNLGYTPQLIVNGTLDCKGNLGGKIRTTSSTGKVSLANTSATLPIATKLVYGATGSTCTSSNQTVNAQIYLLSGTTFSFVNASAASYSSVDYNSEFGFTQNANTNSFVITYNYNGTSSTSTINTQEPSYTIEESDLINLEIEGYTCYGWYADQGYTTPAIGYTINNNTNLYARLIPIIYNIEYHEYIMDDYDDTMQIVNNNDTFFTIADTVTLSPATCGNLDFYGWYIDEDFSISARDINSTTLQYYTRYVMDNTNTIHLYGYFSSVARYSIVYRTQEGVIIETIPGYQVEEGTSIVLADAIPGYESTENLDTTKYAYDLYLFNKWVIYNSSTGQQITQVAANSTYTPTTNITIIPSFAKDSTYVAVETDTIRNSTFTAKVGGVIVGESGSPFYVKVGTQVTFTVTYAHNDSSHTCSFSYKSNGSSSSNLTQTVNYNAKVSATCDENAPCFVRGTLITLADGSQKKIEDLLVTDEIMIFNHFTGKYEKGNIAAIVNHGEELYEIIKLTFSDGTTLEFVSNHGLFDIDEMKYVSFTLETYQNYIGHRFLQYDSNTNSNVLVTLTNSEIIEKVTESWSLFSVVHMNHVINNMLGVSTGLPGFSNFFEFDSDDYSYDEESMTNDINEYGLYTYDDWKDYITEDIFEAFGFAYVKPNVEKGYATKEEIISFIMWFYELVENNSMWTN